MINIIEILKANNIKNGFTLYSPLLEEVILFSFDDNQITVSKENNNNKYLFYFRPDGTFAGYNYPECLLFPDKRCNWSYFQQPKFDPKTLQPFDKVLVRDTVKHNWKCDLFSNIIKCACYPYKCVGNAYICCIPYNDDTKHLVGTTDAAPEFYRYWED